MNREQLAGAWYVVRGKVQEQWGKLTDDDLDVINGRHTQLVGKVRQRYGKTREAAEREVDRWLETIDADATLR